MPLVDLRPLGAPVAPYACKVDRLLVNGVVVPLSRTTVAVLDTGTTGMVISDSLYGSEELPLPGAAMRQVEVQVRTERGKLVRFAASSRRKEPTVLTSVGGQPSYPDFPLIITPVALGWFSPQMDTLHKRRASRRAGPAAVDSDLGREPHVLFLGLAFMEDLRLTIDTDAQRLAVERPQPTRMLSRVTTT